MTTPLKAMMTIVTPRARNAVRKAFRARPDAVAGLSVQEIWNLTHKHAEETPFVTRIGTHGLPIQERASQRYPGHALPSMRYLKKYVLEDMQEDGEIEQVHVFRDRTSLRYVIRAPNRATAFLPGSFQSAEMETWLWRVVPPEQKAQPSPEREPEGGKRKTEMPPTIVPERMPIPELEDDKVPFFPLKMDGWEGRLQFKDVKDLAKRYPCRGRKVTLLRQEQMIDEIPD